MCFNDFVKALLLNASKLRITDLYTKVPILITHKKTALNLAPFL
jgi:hypothetical protein